MAFAPTPPRNTPPAQLLSYATIMAAAGASSSSGGGSGGTSYSLAFTNDPTTGTIGSVIDFSGTVLPSGTPVEFGLSSNGTIFTGGTWAGGTLSAATVSGTLWNENVTLNTAGTFYPFGEITGETTVVGAGIVVSAPSSSLTYTLVANSGTSTGTGLGLVGMTYNTTAPGIPASASNWQTPLAHGSTYVPNIQFNQGTNTSAQQDAVTNAVFYLDTNATATLPGTGGSATYGIVSNNYVLFNSQTAPSAGTYYGKYAFYAGSTLLGVVVTNAITVD